MTGKERFLRAFRHEEADHVPTFEQTISSSVGSAILGRPAFTGGIGLFRDQAEASLRGERAYEEWIDQLYGDIAALAVKLGLDAVSTPWLTGRPTRRLAENTYLYGDENGAHEICRYEPASNSWGTVKKHPPETPESIRRLVDEMASRSPEKPAPERFEGYRRFKRLVGDSLDILGGVGMAIPLRQVWLEMVALDPGLVKAYIDCGVEWALLSMETQAELGIKVMWGGGDMADNHGPTYSPRVFREIMMPAWQRITRRCHELGLYYVFRSDGNLWPIGRELFVECGFDGYGEIDAQAGMDLARLKREFPHIAFWGGVPCGNVLINGTPDEVAACARGAIDAAGHGGGLILGSSNTVLHGTPPENVLALFETAHTYGHYPLGTAD